MPVNTLHGAAGQVARREALGEDDGGARIALARDDDRGVAAHQHREHAVTSPRSAGSSGASTATTPVGSGVEKLKCGPPTGLRVDASARYLSHQPAYQTVRSIAAVDLASRAAGVDRAAGDELRGELAGARFHHLGQPVEDQPAVLAGVWPSQRLVGGARRNDGVTDVLARAVGDVLAADRVGAARLAAHELAVEVELVHLANCQAIGHRRVLWR